MMKEKVKRAVTQAMSHLEHSMDALATGNKDGMENSVWKAASELEYLLFLLSLMQHDELKSPSERTVPRLKTVELGPTLVAAYDALEEVKRSLSLGEFREAYKKARVARNYLLRIQEVFEKERRKKSRGTTPPPA